MICVLKKIFNEFKNRMDQYQIENPLEAQSLHFYYSNSSIFPTETLGFDIAGIGKPRIHLDVPDDSLDICLHYDDKLPVRTYHYWITRPLYKGRKFINFKIANYNANIINNKQLIDLLCKIFKLEFLCDRTGLYCFKMRFQI